MKNASLFCIGLLLVFLFSRCDKTDLTATYIHVDPAALHLDVSDYNQTHGTNYDNTELSCIADQNFHDVWITANGGSLGTWEMPCRIPILGEDSIEVSIWPGVKMNGVSTTRPRYVFVEPYTIKIPGKTGQVIDLENINFKYSEATKFEFIENFNKDYNAVFEATSENGINFEHIADPEHPSNRIGCLALEDTVKEFEIRSSNMTFGNVLPSSVFLEMDYKCDVENANFTVAMLVEKSTSAIATEEPLVIANAKTEWKKIYINLTQSIMRNMTNAIGYHIQISSGREDNNPIHFYFDNIKVIYQ